MIFWGAQAASLSFLRQHKKVEELRSTVANQEAIIAQQQKEFQATAMRQEDKIQALSAALKKQAAQIEKVSAQIEMKSGLRKSWTTSSASEVDRLLRKTMARHAPKARISGG